MDTSFEDSFTGFLRKNFTEDPAPANEKEHFYRKKDGIFVFPAHRIEIVLVPAPQEFPANGPGGFPETAGPDGECVPAAGHKEERDILYLYEDRWHYSRQLMEQRILARLGRFRSIFARKCKVADVQEYCRMKGARSKVEIKKYVNEFNGKIRGFLESCHQYGYAKCRYKYMLLYENEIVAVATFSAPRPMPRFRSWPEKEPHLPVGKQLEGRETADPKINPSGEYMLYRSYEWVRYASLPDVRVVGGMGKLLGAFLREAEAEGGRTEVMTYSDNEWSEGSVYPKLGFFYAGERAPVEYLVNKHTGERIPARRISRISRITEIESDFYRIANKGSRKFLYRPSPSGPGKKKA